jgi:Domain of unknown function (DUF4333)
VRSGTVAAALVAAVASLALGACGVSPRHSLDPVSAEKDIATQLARQYGVPKPAVTCPGGVAVRTGATFVCTTVLDTQPVTLRATIVDSSGRFTATPTKAVIPVRTAAAQIEKSILDQTKRTAHLNCGSRTVLVVPVGGTFDCTAAIQGLANRQVTVTVTGLHGNLRYSLAGSP